MAWGSPSGAGTAAGEGCRSVPMDERYSIDADERPSEGVVAAMARHAGCSPMRLEPLGETIDLEALDAVLESSTASEVTFRCCGATFTVTDRDVLIGDDSDGDD